MRKVSRVLLIAAGAILSFFAVVLLAVNLYVQAQGTQARIQEELSQRLGAKLRIERISITPWSGLKLTGITMPQEDAGAAHDFLKADTFRLRIRFLSLFSDRLIINEVALVNPRVVWAQNAAGKWRLPVTFAETPVEAAAVVPDRIAPENRKAPPPTAPAPPPAVNVPVPAAPPLDSTAAVEAPFSPEVRRVMLRNGSFHFLDAKARPVATFEGVNFRSNLRDGSALRGNASISKISLRDHFFLEELESPVRYDAATLDFSQISARVAGGQIGGRFAINPADPGSPFNVSVTFRDVQADQVVTDAGGPAGMIQGSVEGELTASGKTADANALAGAGEIYLRDAEVRRYSLLVALGQLLQIDELTQLRFDQAQVKYRIQPGVVTIDEVLLLSSNIRLSANGTIGFEGKLRLDAQLAISDRIRGQLFAAIRDNFQPVEPPGYVAVNFQVSGTVERPKTNLMNKVVGGQLKDLGGVINRLFGGDKLNGSKRQKPAEEHSDPAPAPQQAPADTDGRPEDTPAAVASPTPASTP